VTLEIQVGGIVLCGGRSRRMGQPKAWIPFGTERMLPRVVRLLSAAVSPVVVVAAPGQELPELPAGIAIARDPEEGRGPLQGLAAGLDALEGLCDAAYLSSCDVPFLQPALVRRLIELLGDSAICVPYAGGFHHPLAAVYRLSVRGTVGQLLAEQRLRPVFLFESLPTRIVTAEELAGVDPTLQSLRNLNSPKDLEEALRALESGSEFAG
jgi:molybdopterin-guanine dinucleotide biosynthesis protein A